MFHRFTSLALSLVFAAFALLTPLSAIATAKDDKSLTAEQVAETVIFAYGSRPGLAQIRRNGVERGRIVRLDDAGHPVETSYERRFIRGENSAKDRVRLDQKLPTMEYSLVYSGGNTWGVINGATFTPRQAAAQDFLTEIWHSIDALLRYKENGSTISLVGKDKQKNLDLYVLDLKDKDNRTTRFYISAKYFRVLWLEYEQTPAGASSPVKYVRKFYDYRSAQGTLVPFRSVLFESDKQTEETRILTVTYGGKIEEAQFQNSETRASSTQP